ncbi:MAG: hypothetical protein B0A82_24295 [Alkalinema sp. CACIAM 70d]|nr:MAG: hypothetical protein B0A82_24295 [Alkalinema sp. CACIAM 70d]
MTPEDLSHIEDAVGVALPPGYKALQLAYPSEIPPIARGYELLHHPFHVLNENRSVRDGTLSGMAWPQSYFVIGQDGAGNYYCIDSALEEPSVLFFDHADRSFREEAPSLSAWVNQVVQFHNEAQPAVQPDVFAAASRRQKRGLA